MFNEWRVLSVSYKFYPNPITGVDANHSLPYCIAVDTAAPYEPTTGTPIPFNTVLSIPNGKSGAIEYGKSNIIYARAYAKSG